MADSDPLRRYVDAGLALTQLTRARAEALVKELVKAGDLHREQAQERVEELLDRSRRSTDSLAGVIRKEMAQQLSSMGFATKEDLEKLEARMERRIAAMGATGRGTKAAPAKAPPPAKTPAPPKPPRAAKAPGTAKAAPAKAAKAEPVARPAPAAKAAPVSRPTKAAAAPPPGTAARKAAASKNGRRGPATGAAPAPS